MIKKAILFFTVIFSIVVNAQESTVVLNDSVNNLVEFDYSVPLSNLTVADIKVTGADNYEDYVLIGFAGLSVGQIIKVPGPEITSVVNRFWKQGYFSEVKVLATKIKNDSVWLEYKLKQRPKISKVNYFGLKKSEQEDIEGQLTLSKGAQLTPDLIDRIKIACKKYVAEKGFLNADVFVYEKDDASLPGSVILDITVDKNEKVRVRNLIVDGNQALSLNKIDAAMKKTNRASNILNIFRSKKFIQKEYANDKELLIAKYNEVGYRDAKILKDSIIKVDEKTVDVYLSVEEGRKYYFRNITWVGNTVYPSDYLSLVLNVKKGDVYNLKMFNKRLLEDEDAVAGLYKNNGYLFFNIDPVEINIENDSIDFEMRMFEGKPATINKITINGNTRLYEHVIRRELRTKPGALYSQQDLVRTLRELAQMKQFDEEKLYQGVDIQPNPEDGTVDIVYNLETKSSDQVEFSAGYGAQGIVFSLALKFTNFAIQNLFKPKMYRILPQGEGQTFSIKAQTNGVYYQQYGVSFYEPWLGGKRPNSLSVSANYSITTGYSERYQSAYNSTFSNYNYGSSYYGSSYNDYYNSTADYDTSRYLRMLGLSVGFGQRLNWPDDYFQIYYELGYQRYHLNNWYEYYFGFKSGVSNSITLGVTLMRNSIDNPIYTRRGSSFTLSVRATPPYSAFTGRDYSAVPQQEKNEWIEYHKWKFQAKVFTPLTKDDKLVFMARIEYGFLGYYNQYKRSPFEKFNMGGDGMSGYQSSGSEMIGLRGYQSGSLTPIGTDGYEGNLYTKATFEVRYPIMLQQSANIYALAFLEAGNCWSEFSQFNPFDLKRSAGVGVRVFLPMFGLLGVDWGWGFDDVRGSSQYGRSQFHFVLGQEF